MECKRRRSFFDLFRIYDCQGCKHLNEDENFIIGYNNISIYHLFSNCPHLEIDKEVLYYNSWKLKGLMRDAITYQEEILLIFIEDFVFEKNFALIEALFEFNLSIQIITD